jgi:peptide/nickel transport system ATP-binding protein
MTLLSVENLTLSYRTGQAWREVVHNVSFSLKRGEMLAFVGESGSGKTTTAQAIIGLLAENARRDRGEIVLNGETISHWSAKRLDSLRGARISLVPQDPGNALNPVKTIGEQVGEVLRLHRQLSAAERNAQVLSLLQKVGLSHPEQRMAQYPHQLSGGMKQRVLIAIAIALQPEVIIADEPTNGSSICWTRCGANRVLRCCLSPMIWRWPPSAPTGCWCFAMVRSRSTGIRALSFAHRATPIRDSCLAMYAARR